MQIGSSSFLSIAFEAHLTAVQTGVAGGTAKLVALNKIVLDTNNWFNTTTSRYTPQRAGWYQINASVKIQSLENTDKFACLLYKNTSPYATSEVYIGAAGNIALNISKILLLNGTTDYISLYAQHDNSASKGLLNDADTALGGFLIIPT